MKLTKKIQQAVDERLSHPDADAWKSVWKLLDQETQRATKPLEGPDLVARTNRRYGSLSDDQWFIVSFTGGPNGFDPPEALADGAARRLWKNSPVELALRLSFASRYGWATTQLIAHCHFDELWRPMLYAAAARDNIALEKLAELWSKRNEKPNNRAYAAICLAVDALIKRDRELLKEAVAEASKRKPAAYVRSINGVVAAVQEGDAEAFATNLNAMLKSFKSYMFGDESLALIDPYAIGLYLLAERMAPDVVGGFDGSRGLPWDCEYVEWIHTIDDIQAHYEPYEAPQWLRNAMFDMQNLEWAAEVRANW